MTEEFRLRTKLALQKIEAVVYTMPECMACDQVIDSLVQKGFVAVEKDLGKHVQMDNKVREQYEKQNVAPVVEIQGEYVMPRDVIAGNF